MSHYPTIIFPHSFGKKICKLYFKKIKQIHSEVWIETSLFKTKTLRIQREELINESSIDDIVNMVILLLSNKLNTSYKLSGDVFIEYSKSQYDFMGHSHYTYNKHHSPQQTVILSLGGSRTIQEKRITVCNGDVLLYDSSRIHTLSTSSTKSPRLSIVFNIKPFADFESI